MGEDKEIKDAELILDDERRSYPRIALSVPVHYSVVDGDEADKLSHNEIIKKGIEKHRDNMTTGTETENISSGGLLMTTNEQLGQGVLMHLSMHLPLPGLSCNCSILGEVVRSAERENGGFSTAVRFLKIEHHNLNKYKYAALKDLLNIDGPKLKLD